MTKWLLWSAVGFGVIGGVLVFALHPSESSAGPFNLQAVGGVLLAAAVLLAATAAIVLGVRTSAEQGTRQTQTDGSPQLDNENLRAITGLVVVVAAVIAVGVLTIVAINLLGGDDKESTVAITTSAFGIVSAMVSAYLGIKATVNASDKANKALATALSEKGGCDGCTGNGGRQDTPGPAEGGRGE